MERRDRIKIAFFTGSFQCGGVEAFLVRLLQNIDRDRFDPVVMCFEEKGEFLPEIQRLDIDIHAFQIKDSLLSLNGYKAILCAKEFLREQQIQVLYTLTDWGNFFGCVAGKLARVPVVLAGQRNMGHWMVRKRYELGSRLVFKYLSDGIIVNAHAVKRRLIEEFALDEDRVCAIHDGLPLNGLKKDQPVRQRRNGKIVVGYVGRLDHVKGVDLLIEAASQAVDQIPGMSFLIVGDGPDAGELESTVMSKGLSDHVRFAGYQNDVFPLMKTMDLLVLPSRSEGFPYTLVEAMACQLPVVASRVGGVPEIVVDGQTGLLVEPADVDGLARTIATVCTDSALRESMGIQGLHRLKTHFSLEKMVAAHEEYYSQKLGLALNETRPAERVAVAAGY